MTDVNARIEQLIKSVDTAVTIAQGALDALDLFIAQYGTLISDEDMKTIAGALPDARARLAHIKRVNAERKDR